MKVLLQLMLIHYYADGKRSTSAAITRRLDTKIRALVTADPELAKVVIGAKKLAEIAKRKARDAEKKLQQMPYRRHNPGVTHVPCGKGRR